MKCICQPLLGLYGRVNEWCGGSEQFSTRNIEDTLSLCEKLNYSLKNEFWEIKTAQPRRCSVIEKKTLVWEAAKHTSNGNGNRPN